MRTAFYPLVFALAACSQGPAIGRQEVDRAFLKPGDSRAFAIEYVGKVTGIPAGTSKLRVWMPVPQDGAIQSIRGLAFSAPPRIAVEPEYGNQIAYWEIDKPGSTAEVAMKFVCERREIRTDLDRLKLDGRDDDGLYEVFKKDDSLVVVDDEIRRISNEVVRGAAGTLEKGRAVFKHILATMTYDKSGVGWGRGDSCFACRSKKGNCTDFHSLFNALCRAQGIASGFEIGLFLPYERGHGEGLNGYHCWAFFRVPGRTWVPVDCSEARKHPERGEYFFGGLTSNRVSLSTGRDLVLEPKQAGVPLNFLVDPYAEADGRPVTTDKVWSFRDLP